MKVRDSGMPEQAYWESLLDVNAILDVLRVDRSLREVAEIGCGYGTFTIPVAHRISGTLYAYDIEPAMVDVTLDRSQRAGAGNVVVHRRDVLAEGFGAQASSLDAVLLFNILHAENPTFLLATSTAALRPGGRLLAIHWRSDIATPRGPDLSIRPRPEQIATWGAQVPELRLEMPGQIVAPWHFAMSFRRVATNEDAPFVGACT